MWETFDFSDVPNLSAFRWNLVNPREVLPGTLNDTTGEYTYKTDTESSFNRVSGMIPVELETQYHIKADAVYCFGADGTFLSKIVPESGAATLAENTTFVRLAVSSTTEVPEITLLQDGYGKTLDENSDIRYDESFPMFLSENSKQGFLNYLDIQSGGSGNSGISDEQATAITANTAARHTHDNKTVLDGITAEKLDFPLGITSATVGQVPQIASVDTDGKPLTWASTNMPSEDKWELINYVEISSDSEEASAFYFDKDTNGETFELKKAMFLLRLPKYEGESTIPNFGFASINNLTIGPIAPLIYTSIMMPATGGGRTQLWELGVERGLWHEKMQNTDHPTIFGKTSENATNSSREFWDIRSETLEKFYPIKKVGFTNGLVFSGCKYWLYGVRK